MELSLPYNPDQFRRSYGLGFFPFRSPLLREFTEVLTPLSHNMSMHMNEILIYCSLFLRLLRCFTSAGTHPAYNRMNRFCTKTEGFPIRKSPDQRLLGTSPKLIAAKPRLSSPLRTKASTICSY